MTIPVPPLLERRSTDEYEPLPRAAADRQALARLVASVPAPAHALGVDDLDYTVDRRGTAATLRALDEAHGGGFYTVPEEATLDLAAAEETFRGGAPVIDVQTHLVDPSRWHGPGAEALGGFLRLVDSDRWADPFDPLAIDGAAWASCMFG